LADELSIRIDRLVARSGSLCPHYTHIALIAASVRGDMSSLWPLRKMPSMFNETISSAFNCGALTSGEATATLDKKFSFLEGGSGNSASDDFPAGGSIHTVTALGASCSGM